MVQRYILGARRYLREVVRLLRVAMAPGGTRVVAYTKPHPIYSDFFDRHGIPGYRFHRAASYRSLRPLARLGWRKVRLVHRDAAWAPEEPWHGPQIVECEGRPSAAMLEDPALGRVFVQSTWAAADLLSNGTVELLRPACPVPPMRTRTRRGRQPVTLLAVGYGSMIKGYDALDEVWRALGERDDVRLIVAGATGHEWHWYPEITREAYEAAGFPAMLARWQDDPRVSIGPIARETLLDEVYWRADIYLHLARMETFGYSILEAMARALPVIATGINAIPEMVRHEETGFVIDASRFDINAPAWRTHVANEATRHVRRLIDDQALRERLGAAGRARVEHAFSVEHRRRMLDRVYRDALNGGGRREPSAGTAARHFHSSGVQ